MGLADRLREWLTADDRRSDAILTVVVLVLVVAQLIFPTATADDQPLNAVGVALAIGPVLLLLARRRAPVTTLALGSLLGFSYWIADFPGGGAAPALFVLVYSAAIYVKDRRAATLTITVFTIALLGVLITGLFWGDEEEVTVGIIIVNLILFELAWLLGDTVRNRRERERDLREQMQKVELARQQATTDAIAAERNRIATELHDILAHSMSVVVVQASGAKRLVGTDDEAVCSALEAIESTGRQTLQDIRGAVGALRSPEDQEPSARLSMIPALIESCADAGLRVDVDVTGDQRELSPMLELSAFRIVQESLTNVIKHAGPKATAQVVLGYDAHELEISVRDTGRGASANIGSGHGLTGMRERVQSFGGSFSSGPQLGGGYSIDATLPIGSP